jgi:hypothetical protein
MGSWTFLGRDSEGRVRDIRPEDMGVADHDGLYAPVAHAHPAEEHTHAELLHDHPYASDSHTHDLSGYAVAGHTHGAEGHVHAEYAPEDHTHPADVHGHPEYALDDHAHDLTHSHAEYSTTNHTHATYATTGHTHDTSHNHDAAYSATGHTHNYAATSHAHVLTEPDIPAAIARDSEVTAAIATHAATPHGGVSELPVGSGFITFANTNPASLLGYGTWTQRGAGRFIVGADGGTFGTGGTTGGALTHGHTLTNPTVQGEAAHTHAYTQVINHTHAMVASNTAGTSGTSVTRGAGTQATVTAPNPAGGVASGTTAAGSSHTHVLSGGSVADSNVLPPWFSVYLWERTA